MIDGGGGGIGKDMCSSIGGNISTDSKIVIPKI
jgi:hypothetical protein